MKNYSGKNSIKFSIVIPIYNMEKSIENTVTSLLKQTYQNYEIILVDDGSKDRSGEICDYLANKNADYIKTIHTKNCGSGPARNTGIDIASGDYIYFPDADDLVDERALEILSKVIYKKRVDLVVFGYKIIDRNDNDIFIKKYSNKEFKGKDIRNYYINFCSMYAEYGIQGAPWNKIFKLDLIKRNEIRFPKLRRHQDDAFIGLYVSYIEDVKFIDSILYSYFENDLKNEWDKYPNDYIDCVIGLYENRKNSLLKWNYKDKETHNFVALSYITGVIKSLELSFSPKYKFKKKERKKWQNQIINKTAIKEMSIPKEYSMKYQRFVLWLIKKNYKNVLYKVLKFKIIMESKLKKIYKIIKKIEKDRV